MKRIPFVSLVLSALVAGCAHNGLVAARERHTSATTEADNRRAEADRIATEAAKASAEAETAGKALAGELVKAAMEDIRAAEATKREAERKRAEACRLNPDLPECKTDQPPPPVPVPTAPKAPAPTPPAPASPAPAQAEEAPQAEPEPDLLIVAEVPPYARIKLVKEDGKTKRVFLVPPPDGWKVDWKFEGVLFVEIDGNEKYTIQKGRLGINTCWRLFESSTDITEEKCPTSPTTPTK